MMDSEMKLPEGRTCGECYAFKHCKGLFGCKSYNTECDYFPVRFRIKTPPRDPQESD